MSKLFCSLYIVGRAVDGVVIAAGGIYGCVEIVWAHLSPQRDPIWTWRVCGRFGPTGPLDVGLVLKLKACAPYPWRDGIRDGRNLFPWDASELEQAAYLQEFVHEFSERIKT